MIHDDANFVTLHESPQALENLAIHLVRGREALGRMFSYTIGVFGPPVSSTTSLADILGERLTLKIKTSEEGADLDGQALPQVRYLSGIIRRFWQRDQETSGIESHVVYELELVPTLGLLETRTNSRIFQNRNTREIVDLVLKDHDIQTSLDPSRLGGSVWPWKPREYCVQYNETDLDFVQRLLEEDGMGYFFEHGENGDVLVLASEESHYGSFNEPYADRQARDADETLPSFSGTYKRLELNRAAAVTSESLSSWCRQWTRTPSRYESIDFDAMQQTAASQVLRRQWPDDASASGPGTSYDAYAGLAAEQEQTDSGDQDPFNPLTAIRLAELTSKSESWFGSTRSRGVATGHRYEVQTADDLRTVLAVRADLLIQRIRNPSVGLQGHAPTPIPEPGTNNTSWSHEVNMEAVLASVRFVPDRVTPRPRIHGPHTAFVVDDNGRLPGASADDSVPASMDNKARVRVRMHWNQDPELDDSDEPVEIDSETHPWQTCKLRVAQPTAGKGWGSWTVPHIGDEVLVSFINGDPDRPVITGRLYNRNHSPDDKTVAEPALSDREERTNHMQVVGDKAGNHVVMNSDPNDTNIVIRSPGNASDTGDSQIWIGGPRKVNLTYVSDIFGGQASSSKDRGGIALYTSSDYTVKVEGNDIQQIDGNSFDIVTGMDYSVALTGSIGFTVGFAIEGFVGIKAEYTIGLLTYNQSAGVKYEVTNEKGFGYHFNDGGGEARGKHEVFGGEKVVLGGGGTVRPFPGGQMGVRAMMAVPLAPLIASAGSKFLGKSVMPTAYKSAMVLDADGATMRSNLDGCNDSKYFDTKPKTHAGLGRVSVLADGTIELQTTEGMITIGSKGIELTSYSGKAITLWSDAAVEIKGKEVKLVGKITANGMQIGAPPAPPPPMGPAAAPAAPAASITPDVLSAAKAALKPI